MIAKTRKNGVTRTGEQRYSVYVYLGDNKKLNLVDTSSKRTLNRAHKNINKLLEIVQNGENEGSNTTG